MTKENLLGIVDDILDEMYSKSTPKGNYYELINLYRDSGHPFYLDFEISQSVAEGILEKHTKNLRKFDKELVCGSVWLGVSPKFKECND